MARRPRVGEAADALRGVANPLRPPAEIEAWVHPHRRTACLQLGLLVALVTIAVVRPWSGMWGALLVLDSFSLGWWASGPRPRRVKR